MGGMVVSNPKAKEWQKLSPYQQARLRTEMWLGSRDPHTQVVLEYNPSPVAVETTWVPALFTAFREIFDNALDETACHGNGDRVDVEFDPKTLTVVVRDNGRGIPIEFDETEQKYAATVLLTEAFAGRNFDDDTRGNTRGLNGVGGAIVNYTSEYFTMDIERDGKSFSQRFQESATEHVIETPIIFPHKKKTKATGTRIEFKMSQKVFKHLVMPENFIRARIYEAALCYPHMKLFFNGTQIKATSVEKDLFPKHKPIQILIDKPGFKSQFWLVPDFFPNGTELTHSLVNAIPVFNGGVHIDTFKRVFFTGLLTAMKPKSKTRRLEPNRSDIIDGMLIYNITEMEGPHFDSQAKTRLSNESVGKLVQTALDDPDFFKAIIRRNPEFIESIYQKCADRTQKRDAADVLKMARKTGKVRVAKLKDATHTDRSKCSLYITEGDSAVGGLVDARDSSIHAAMPLKGKVMNVFGLTAKQIYENEELTRMMNAIGLIPGQRVNRHSLRYGRIYITTDADEDGKSICGLLTNFFYLNWPELFDPAKPLIHVFETPLIIAAKGKERKYWYADNVDSFVPDKFKGWEITRLKGLAQLKKEDWEFALNNPKSLPLTDDGELKEALGLLFDQKRADDRKNFIGM